MNPFSYLNEPGYRKTAVAQVTVYDAGSGKFEINGQGVDYFESKYAR